MRDSVRVTVSDRGKNLPIGRIGMKIRLMIVWVSRFWAGIRGIRFT